MGRARGSDFPFRVFLYFFAFPSGALGRPVNETVCVSGSFFASLGGAFPGGGVSEGNVTDADSDGRVFFIVAQF